MKVELTLTHRKQRIKVDKTIDCMSDSSHVIYSYTLSSWQKMLPTNSNTNETIQVALRINSFNYINDVKETIIARALFYYQSLLISQTFSRNIGI